MNLALATLVLVNIGASFDVQYTEPYALEPFVETLVLDADEFGPDVILPLRAKGTRVLCYVSVGTLEEFRGDIAKFPKKVIGKGLPDWPDERYLDIRAQKTLLPLMKARFQRCKDAGFDGISPDNLDVYTNDSGFDLSRGDALAYIAALADLAHGMDMLIGQKNVPELAPDLVDKLDYVITESCWKWDFCDQFAGFTAAKKPIFDIEYTDDFPDFEAACGKAREVGITMILKERNLTGAFYQACP